MVRSALSNGRSYHRQGPQPLITPAHYQPHTGLSLKGESARLQSFTLSQGPISASASLSAVKKQREREERERDGGRRKGKEGVGGTERLFHAAQRKTYHRNCGGISTRVHAAASAERMEKP